MAHIAEVAGMANEITKLKQAENYENLSMSILKESIAIQAQLQQELAVMISNMLPYLG